MKTIYKSDNGNEFDTEKECVAYEISYYKLKIINANTLYLHYKVFTHKRHCRDYEKIIKQNFKDTKGLFDKVSNTKARKLYWELRKKYKDIMLKSIKYIRELKEEIRKNQKIMKEYIDLRELV